MAWGKKAAAPKVAKKVVVKSTVKAKVKARHTGGPKTPAAKTATDYKAQHAAPDDGGIEWGNL
jgi:hypothetical protein